MRVRCLGRGFICVCVCKGNDPHLPEPIMISIWYQKSKLGQAGADGLNSHFESIMTGPMVLSAGITE